MSFPGLCIEVNRTFLSKCLMPIPGFVVSCGPLPSKSILKSTGWIPVNTLSSPNATDPLQRFGKQQNPRGSRKGKSPALVIRPTIKPFLCPVRPTLGRRSSRLILVSPSTRLLLSRAHLTPYLRTPFSYDRSRFSTHAARAHLAGFLQLSVARSPDPPDPTRLQRRVFLIAPTNISGSLFPILFTHGANTGFDT